MSHESIVIRSYLEYTQIRDKNTGQRGSVMKSLHALINDTLPDMLPVVPTMDVVVFPNQIVPLLVLDDRIIRGINKASGARSKLVLLLASKKQSDTHQGVIGTKDLFDVGTVATVMRVIKIPDGGIKILVQGMSRAFVHDIIAEEEVLKADIEPFVFEDDPAKR